MVAGFFIGSLDNASNSLVLYMLGPARSPPFTQSLHAMVGLGFMLGSIVVRWDKQINKDKDANRTALTDSCSRPFLPEESVSEGHGAVCPDSSDVVTSNVTAVTRVTSVTTVLPLHLILRRTRSATTLRNLG